MNLHMPLILTDCKTIDVSMTPTKRFFKPVLQFAAPIDPERAELLGAAHLFDAAGNPRQFDGTYKVHGELAAPNLELKPKKGPAASIKTEKVAHFSFSREEKKGMRLTMRVHLPEDETQLLALLNMLATLNKEGFTLTVIDAQRSLIEKPRQEPVAGDQKYTPPVHDQHGNYDATAAVSRPFDEGPIKAKILTLDVDGGFIFGWEFKAALKAEAIAKGQVLNTDCIVFNAESSAREAGAEAIWNAAHSDRLQAVIGKGKETKALLALESWLIDCAPSLRDRPGLTAAPAAKGATIQ